MDTIEIKGTPAHYSVARGRRPVNHFQIEPAVNFRNNNGSGFQTLPAAKRCTQNRDFAACFRRLAQNPTHAATFVKAKPVKNSLDANSRAGRSSRRFEISWPDQSRHRHAAKSIARGCLGVQRKSAAPGGESRAMVGKPPEEALESRRYALRSAGMKRAQWRKKIRRRSTEIAAGDSPADQRMKSFVFERPPESFVFARVLRQARQARHGQRHQNRAGEVESAGGESARACGKCLDWWHLPARVVPNRRETRAIPRAPLRAADE